MLVKIHKCGSKQYSMLNNLQGVTLEIGLDSIQNQYIHLNFFKRKHLNSISSKEST